MVCQVELARIGDKGESVSVSKLPALIGRSPSADVHCPEPDVSGRHVRLESSANGVVAVNLSKHRTVLNGRRLSVDEQVLVAEGDVLELGAHVRLRVRSLSASPVRADEAETDVGTGGGDAAATMTMAEGTLTGVPIGSMEETQFVSAPDAEEQGGGETTNGGETRVIETHIASPEELAAARAGMERANRVRRGLFFGALALFAGLLAALYVFRQTHLETEWMSLPLDPQTGRPSVAAFVVRDDQSNALLRVDYPRTPQLVVRADEARPELEVESAMGRDGDVPYRLNFTAVRRTDELELSLDESMWRWMSLRRKVEGDMTFEAQTREELRTRFFEDEYGWCCQQATEHGVRFIRQRYQHARADGNVWCGYVLYFRLGDVAYALCREIPEAYWKRGSGQLLADPNVGLFRAYSLAYWESPGRAAMPLEWSRERLLDEIRLELNPERSGIWRKVHGWIDALIVKSWSARASDRSAAFALLAQLREYENNFYWGKYNAYDAARTNRADKRCRLIRQDCKSVFSNPADRRYHLINNAEIW